MASSHQISLSTPVRFPYRSLCACIARAVLHSVAAASQLDACVAAILSKEFTAGKLYSTRPICVPTQCGIFCTHIPSQATPAADA